MIPYHLVLAPAGGARVERLHDPGRDVAITWGDAIDVVAGAWGEVLRRQRIMLDAHTSTWRGWGWRQVEVVVVRPELVLESEDPELALETAAIRHFLGLIDQHGGPFGFTVHTPPLAMVGVAA